MQFIWRLTITSRCNKYSVGIINYCYYSEAGLIIGRALNILTLCFFSPVFPSCIYILIFVSFLEYSTKSYIGYVFNRYLTEWMECLNQHFILFVFYISTSILFSESVK